MYEKTGFFVIAQENFYYLWHVDWKCFSRDAPSFEIKYTDRSKSQGRAFG